MQSVSCRTG